MATMEEMQDVIQTMKVQENSTYTCKRRVRPADLSLESEFMFQPSWRRSILEWMYGLTEKCSALPKEAVSTAAHYIDVCTSKGLVQSKCEFKLVSMTSLLIATKVLGSLSVTVFDLAALGQGQFTAGDLIRMEQPILNALDWQLHPPTSEYFVHQFMKLLPAKTKSETITQIQRSSVFLANVANCRMGLAHEFLASELAFASILISMESQGHEELPIWQRQSFLVHMMLFADVKSSGPAIQMATAQMNTLLQETSISDKMIQIHGNVRQSLVITQDLVPEEKAQTALPEHFRSSPKSVAS